MNVSQSKYHITRIDKNRQQHDFRKRLLYYSALQKEQNKSYKRCRGEVPTPSLPAPHRVLPRPVPRILQRLRLVQLKTDADVISVKV